MKLLVIGGSYFYGRVFVMQAAGKHEVTVVNRGTYSMAQLGVREIRGDRRDEKLWQSIQEDYDVIVDFCAYEKGDIARVLENMPGKVKQYIFISTVDVYERGRTAGEERREPVESGNGDKYEEPAESGNGDKYEESAESRKVEKCAESVGDITGKTAEISGNAAKGETEETGRRHSYVSVKKDEESPLETRIFPGEAGQPEEVGQYIAGKVALEREVKAECGKREIGCTVLRPAILYGPFNYAPREPLYIQMIVQNGILPHIKGADGVFQMIYVKDAAEAILKCLLNENAYGQAYNLCQDEIVNYDSFYEELKNAVGTESTEPEELAVTVEEALSRGIPLPFPVTEEESELCSNEKSKTELGMEYLSFSEGIARTYRAFRGVFGAAD